MSVVAAEIVPIIHMYISMYMVCKNNIDKVNSIAEPETTHSKKKEKGEVYHDICSDSSLVTSLYNAMKLFSIYMNHSIIDLIS